MSNSPFASLNIIDSEIDLDSAPHIDKSIKSSSLFSKLESASSRSQSIKIIKAELAKIGITHFSIRQIFKQGEIELPVATFPNGLNGKIAKLALGVHDIAIDYAFAGNHRPLFLSEISGYLDKAMFSTRGLQKNRQLKELYSRFGFEELLFIPMLMKGQTATLLFAIGIVDMPPDDFHQVMQSNHDFLIDIVKAVATVGIAETKRPADPEKNDKKSELEQNAFALLTIMATRNISLKGAGALMGISSGIANKYIAFAKSILNTSSQTNAIYLAIKQGRIQCEPIRQAD
jgi:hypothetical protein